jgi:hypothetical protein
MDTYDERVVAGEGDYLFSEVLLDLATQLQIPPPVFCGKMQYKEYGMEKWLIQTTIQGRLDEEGESTMEYTEAYVDWRYSVEIAITTRNVLTSDVFIMTLEESVIDP